MPTRQAALDFVAQKQPRDEYGRYSNPGERVAERKLAALEGGEAAVLYASGMAAMAGLLLAKLKAGDEIVMFNECYHRTRELCVKYLGRLRRGHAPGAGLRLRGHGSSHHADHATVDQRIAHQSAPERGRSGTFCRLGPQARRGDHDRRHLGHALQRPPLEFGVDYVLHSCTKYLAGHNDMLGGAVMASAEKIEPLRRLRGVLGMVNGPHNIYLLLRGLKTFELRMRRHNENGQAVAEFLAGHPRVEKVYYPGLPSHPYYEVARRTMRGFGGLVTFLVKDADDRQTAAVVDAVRIPRIGPSLGGVESLIEQPMVMSYHDFTPEQRRAMGIPDNMIRIACGIENSEDLIADLRQALQRV